jgi:peptidoglycan/xylan/chitin deacetylase (PgdA/CDA1 family)
MEALMLVFLVYHKIQDHHRKGDIYTVSPTSFMAQLSMVQQAGLPILNPRVLSRSRDHWQSGVVLTFDDGTTDHFEVVRPLLREFGIQALFYISTTRLNRDKYLTSEQVRQLWESGHTIGSHSHVHKRLDVEPWEQVTQELELSAMAIQNIIGQLPVHFAPPGGFYNRSVQEIAQRVGYSFCRTMDWGYNRLFDPMRIEIVPVTDALGTYFLKYALSGRLEQTLKFSYHLKNGLRTFLPSFSYHKFRARIMLDQQ